MTNYKYLLWDVDGTILDFEAAERASIRALFDKYHLGECTDDMLQNYSKINKKYWEALERGKMTKPQILVGRFTEFLTTEGIDAGIAEQFNSDYQLALGDTIVFHDDALEILKQQKKNHTLVLITNGTKKAQQKKLSRSGLDKVVDHIFISEDVGVEKPNKNFFDVVINAVGITDLKDALIIGDSLTSDIQGGLNSGIDTCWYNFDNKTNESKIHPTYTITNLHELISII